MGIAIFVLQYYNTLVFCFREKECAVQHILFLVHNEYRSQSVRYLVRNKQLRRSLRHLVF